MLRRVFILILTIRLAVGVVVAKELIWLEAEQFDTLGGWTNDAQFLDQMGSPYLMAIGLGRPVEDAKTRGPVEATGKYRLWVRSKDWAPEHSPGKFKVLVNGRADDRVFGASGEPGWRWESGGVHELSGDVHLRLEDQTGFYGRCDVVALASDIEWIPPESTEAIARLRETHGGVSGRIENMPRRDVVVVGGGLAGCTAAVAAARNGASVALIQNRPVLGGNASSEILVPPVGASAGVFRKNFPLDPRETGLIEEYRTAGNQRVAEGRLYSNRLLRFVKLEPNLGLYLNTHATGVEMAPGPDKKIRSVLAVDVVSGKRIRFPAKMFIDCSGDAVVGAAAGAEYRHGKEPKSMYGEPWAPEKPSKETMGNGLKYFAKEADGERPFEAPKFANEFPTCESFGPGRHPKLTDTIEIQGQFRIELGGLRDTVDDAEEIRDDLLRLIYGIWDHTKNRCPKLKGRAADYELVWVGHVTGKRENRRLMGDCVLTQNDIARQTLFPDRVAFGAWSVDDHYSAGFFHDGPTGRHFDGADHHYKGVPFSIPFRSLYSKNIDNLMMAGRDISASHLGMSNTRVMLTCAILGHAAGTGAAFCVREATTPRGVYRDHLTALQQQLLKEGAAILDLKANDPRDLAQRAAASASSERVHTSGEKMAPVNAIDGFARAAGRRSEETTHAWGADESSPGPHWIELAWEKTVSFNMVHVVFQTADLAPEWFAVEASSAGQWRTIAEVDDNRHRRHVLGLDRVTGEALRVKLREPAGICEIRVYDEPERSVAIARRAHANMRATDVGPWLPWGDDLPLTQERRGPRGIDPARLPGVTVDDRQAEMIGEWTRSTHTPPYLHNGYSHDDNKGKGAKRIRFRLVAPKPGAYEARLAYSALANRASNTPVTITTPRGAKTIHVDQRLKPPINGLFVTLGIFELAAGDEMVVDVANTDTDGYVVVDGVQIERSE